MIIDVVLSISIFISGFFSVQLVKMSESEKDKRYLNLLWVFHFLVSISYYFYILNNGGDAMRYWNVARRMNTEDFLDALFSGQGTEFMDAFNYLFANVLGLGFFANTLLYGLLGFIGFLLFYRICLDTISYNSKLYKFRLFPLLFFLPNLHFWSSGIGKDTTLFLCIAMVAYGLMRISKRFPLIVIGLLLSYCIRPHITLILGMSFGLAYILNGKISKGQRTFLAFILFALSLVILPKVLEFVKIEDASMESFEKFSTGQATGLSNAGSAVDISSYPYPLKVLTFLYRPFFFDINGIPALVASFENLLLLLLSIQVIRSRFFQTFKAAPLVIQGLFLFSMLGVLSFSMSMSNLGIILRMRNMFLPSIIIFILWSFSYRKEYALSKRKENV